MPKRAERILNHKEVYMKKIFSFMIGLFIIFMLPFVPAWSDVSASSGGAEVTKQKPAKDVPAANVKKPVVKKGVKVQKGPYIGGQLGTAFIADDEKFSRVVLEFAPGVAVGATVGYRFGKLRAEGELGYQTNDFDKCNLSRRELSVSGDVAGKSFLINGYYDFINKTAFTPYLTAGIGTARIELNDLTIAGRKIGSADDTVFAYQVGAGVGYAVNKNYTIDLKYRFCSTTEPEFNGVKSEFGSHNIYLGLRYNF